MPSPDGTNYSWTGQPPFERVSGSCASRTMKAVTAGAGLGTFVGSCIMAWSPENMPEKGRLGGGEGFFRGFSPTPTRMSTTIAGMARPAVFFGAVAGAFATVDCIAEEARGERDSWNAAIGGAAAGMLMAAKTRRFDYMAGAALGTALLCFAVDMCGPALSEYNDKRMENKIMGVRSLEYEDSDRLKGLKEMYPYAYKAGPKA
uniref:Mitochondrial import inner membrane translocase subunit TIM22 n=1 Tax=Leptocylindrus danicus TaxID=163516 RepID=A0A7S2LNR3_9STRA|mmetsp:Transcript_8062/g.12001  ORF Transcript_8062/g.12001 Transcript_8062/m.12001 type:complete len:203 (+) Transcript_8062:68-676(+)